MMRTWRRRKKKKRNPHLYPAFLYKLMLVINYFDHKGINKQAGAAPGFSAKGFCLVWYLENLMSIFH